VRNEPLGKLFFRSENLGRFIDIFLATHITSNAERPMDRRPRDHRVGLGERDFMSINEVARNVVDVIFAVYDPAVRTVLPHALSS
jgi:hypothetical protein